MKEKKQIFDFTKGKAAGALAATAAMLIVAGLAATEESSVPVVLIAAVLAAAGCAFLFLKYKFGTALSAFLYLLIPALSFMALENYTHVLTDLKVPIIILNLLFFYLLYGFMAFLFGSVRWGYSIATLVPMLFGLANYFVVSFRSSPIVPWDLLSLGTAVSVADNYTFSMSTKAAFVVIAYVWIFLLLSKCTLRFRKLMIRIPVGFIYGLLLVIYLTAIQKASVQKFFGMDTTLFTLNVLYRNNGIAAAFLGNLRFLNIEEPDGYSAERVEKIAEEAEVKYDSEYAKSDESVAVRYPNIVVIMDEAFSDLSVWGDFETTEPVMPFFKSLQQEAVGGELYVSVKGGNTANTEFEFLTGDTMAFLPAGSVAYQQYIHSELHALPSYLKSLGYTTTALHPYNASGWDRNKVYEWFGFDTFLSKSTFSNAMTLRGYVSDQSAFEKIEELFEEKEPGVPGLYFEVTMQNHGGYSKASPDFSPYIHFKNTTEQGLSVEATEKYLSLMRETDLALENLIHYFESQDEPVVVVMFGDHQPSDYITNVVRRICGIPQGTTLEEIQQGYRVPFLVWSNYGLEHQYYDGISVNYLSGIVLRQVGIPLTGYQKYLTQLMGTLPVVNANVIRDNTGTFHPLDDSEYADILNDYKILQYNHLTDKKHCRSAFFGG